MNYMLELEKIIPDKEERKDISGKIRASADNHLSKLKKHKQYVIKAYNGAGIDAMTRDQFMQYCKWNVHRCGVELALASKYSICPYCGRYYTDIAKEVQFGRRIYGIIEIETIDSDELPYWGFNTQFCCSTCNRKKHNKTMREFVDMIKRQSREISDDLSNLPLLSWVDTP